MFSRYYCFFFFFPFFSDSLERQLFFNCRDHFSTDYLWICTTNLLREVDDLLDQINEKCCRNCISGMPSSSACKESVDLVRFFWMKHFCILRMQCVEQVIRRLSFSLSLNSLITSLSSSSFFFYSNFLNLQNNTKILLFAEN